MNNSINKILKKMNKFFVNQGKLVKFLNKIKRERKKTSWNDWIKETTNRLAKKYMRKQLIKLIDEIDFDFENQEIIMPDDKQKEKSDREMLYEMYRNRNKEGTAISALDFILTGEDDLRIGAKFDENGKLIDFMLYR